MVNTLIPPTGGSDVVRGNQKKLRIMKKEYLSPEMQVVKFTINSNILAASEMPGGEGDVIPDVKEENGSTNTTVGGGSIWDNEW